MRNKKKRRQRGSWQETRAIASSNLCLTVKFLLVGYFSSKNTFGAKSPIWGEFKGNIEIWNTIIFQVRNVKLSVGKLQLRSCPYFL